MFLVATVYVTACQHMACSGDNDICRQIKQYFIDHDERLVHVGKSQLQAKHQDLQA